jgi:hypothetical protein
MSERLSASVSPRVLPDLASTASEEESPSLTSRAIECGLVSKSDEVIVSATVLGELLVLDTESPAVAESLAGRDLVIVMVMTSPDDQPSVAERGLEVPLAILSEEVTASLVLRF